MIRTESIFIKSGTLRKFVLYDNVAFRVYKITAIQKMSQNLYF